MNLATAQRAGLALAGLPPQHRWIWGAVGVGAVWWATRKYNVKVGKDFFAGAGVGAAGVMALLFLFKGGAVQQAVTTAFAPKEST